MSQRPNHFHDENQLKVESDVDAFLKAGGTIEVVGNNLCKGLQPFDYNNVKRTKKERSAIGVKGGLGRRDAIEVAK